MSSGLQVLRDVVISIVLLVLVAIALGGIGRMVWCLAQ